MTPELQQVLLNYAQMAQVCCIQSCFNHWSAGGRVMYGLEAPLAWQAHLAHTTTGRDFHGK
jgi:hypothetical protein